MEGPAEVFHPFLHECILMWSAIADWKNWGMSHVYGLDRNEWFIVLVVVMLLGFLCMRGFGSRKNY